MNTIKYKECFNINYFEHQAWKENNFICGIDEAGRGSLVGPIVCAAAIIPENIHNPLIKDSKKLSAKQRDDAYAWLVQNSIFQYSIIDHHLIERHNIYQATLQGMERAILHLLMKIGKYPQAILIDAMPLKLKTPPFDTIPIYSFNHGEDKSTSIAAASIIAKVTRDRIMNQCDSLFPAYNLKNNKGYGTPQHKKALKNGAFSIIHRQSFLD